MEMSKTVDEWEFDFGSQVRALRLHANLNQVTLAERAGIGLTALKNLESGKGATVKTLIKTLRTLNRAAWLLTLAPSISISPLQMLKTKSVRQRASPRRVQQITKEGT